MSVARLRVEPAAAPIGADVFGVDLSAPLDDALFAAIESAFDRHSVLCIRDQRLTPAAQLAFSARFGELEINAFSKFAVADHPGVLRVSNIKLDGRDIGYADAGTDWHSDMSYTATPPRATLLHALEVPHDEHGEPLGPTLFASAAAAYEALDEATRESLEGLRAVHRFSAKRRGVDKPVALTPEQLARYPDVSHPVVRTHPRTGRKALYVTADECVAIEGMDAEQARALIDRLAAHLISEPVRYQHRWQVGDLLMWDNAAVQHIALRDYAWPQRRLMHRTTVNGSVPF